MQGFHAFSKIGRQRCPASLVELEGEIQQLREELKSVSKIAKESQVDHSHSLRTPSSSNQPADEPSLDQNEITRPFISPSSTPTQSQQQEDPTDISRSCQLGNNKGGPNPSTPGFRAPLHVQDDDHTMRGRVGAGRSASCNQAPSEAESEADYMHYHHLNAPVTAVQSMESTSPHSDVALRSVSHDAGGTQRGQAWPESVGRLAAPSDETSDIVSELFKDESQARLLFASYFEGGNPYIPMFDPIVDTFDSLRTRSPFCLIAILFIALKQTSHILHGASTDLQTKVREACLQEARRWVFDSIFEHPTLETVQAMTLLAANAEKSWLAIGHAHQMALELGLDCALNELVGEDSLTTDRRNFHIGSRKARTWCILYHIERELAVGTARKPRIHELDKALLRPYLDLPVSYPSDMRFISTIEIVQLRSDIQSRVESATSVSTISESVLQEFEQKAQEWFQYWDTRFKAYNVDEDSLNRISLLTQKNYSRITICCTILGRLHKNTNTPCLAIMEEVVRRIAETISDQLDVVSRSKSYRWHFRWAPTYSALMLTFSLVLALQLANRWPGHLDKAQTERQVRSVLGLLEMHPYQSLVLQVRRMLDRSAEERLPWQQRLATWPIEDPKRGASMQSGREHDPPPEKQAPASSGEYGGVLQHTECMDSSNPELENLDWLSGGSILENWTLLELGNSMSYDMSMFGGNGTV
ncbi:uncharacterized protein PV07_09003 [Cladophialophora immunda]|uniref:Xylanolytic transcriptional activator regulatory domain-containing protein n=1 Tax=Cladophialophora immunda TaxID=569365 RepID=A0A0D2ALF5_9EURO|nr:uncharacterized protein PV07_09003 [Cladophialophora immunda]KIW25867.1 hypothetical protein PV07_09003 [Cladophialophora immunda]